VAEHGTFNPLVVGSNPTRLAAIRAWERDLTERKRRQRTAAERYDRRMRWTALSAQGYPRSMDRPHKRDYRMTKRAKRQADTRERIIEAAIVLHGSPGMAGVTGIAELAGVSRVTVYRHFPDELSLFVACTATYFQRHPPPDPAAWLAIDDPDRRLEVCLQEVYAYYADTEPMATQAGIGVALKPALAEALVPFGEGMAALGAALLHGLAVDAGPGSLVAAAVGHAMAFGTWRSLRREQGLTDSEAVALMAALIRTAAGRSGVRSG
jgi:AcrR family transcriptional regulator